MANRANVEVIGTALAAPLESVDRSLEETLYDVGRAALADAGMTHDDIDGIVVAGNDQFDGRSISVMMASGPLGGVGRDILSTPSAAEHAFVMGALRVASGLHRTQLVVAWSPMEVGSLSAVERLGTDPYFHRQLPLDGLSAAALQAAALEHAYPEAHAAALLVVKKNRGNARRAYPHLPVGPTDAQEITESAVLDWPICEAMVAAPCAGAVGLVLADAESYGGQPDRDAALVLGMGWATEPAFLGDRVLVGAPALEAAASQAYGEAGISDPRGEIDLAEVSDATPYEELIAYQALGLCPPADWRATLAMGEHDAGGRLPVNVSGGALSVNHVFSNGLARIAETANQIRGRAGAHQLPGVNVALAHAASGFAMQYQTVVVLGTGREGMPT